METLFVPKEVLIDSAGVAPVNSVLHSNQPIVTAAENDCFVNNQACTLVMEYMPNMLHAANSGSLPAAVMFENCGDILSPAEACNKISAIATNSVSQGPVSQPHGGQMFVYDTVHYFTNPLADSYQWIHESKEKFIIGKDTLHIVICVQSDIAPGENALMRFYYTLLNSPQYTLVHYVADDDDDDESDNEPRENETLTKSTTTDGPPAKKAKMSDIQVAATVCKAKAKELKGEYSRDRIVSIIKNKPAHISDIKKEPPDSCEPYTTSVDPLTPDAVIDILENVQLDRVIKICPHRPRHGDVYVCPTKDASGNKLQPSRNDGYSWAYGGSRTFRKGLVSRRTYHLKNIERAVENGFQRFSFTSTVDDGKHVIIQYVGNKALLQWHHKTNLKIDSASKEGAYARSMEHLSGEEAVHIFETLDMEKTRKTCPNLPKPSYIYVFDTRDEEDTHSDKWKQDGYTWKPIGTKQYCNGKILKQYYSSLWDEKRLNLNFQRLCFKLMDNDDFVIVQYVGDNKPQTPTDTQEEKEAAERKRVKEISDEGCESEKAKEIYNALCQEKVEKMIAKAKELVSSGEDHTGCSYAYTPDSLLPNNVMYILKTLDIDRVVGSIVHRPRAGSVIVYDTINTEHHPDKNYWRNDGYSWIHRGQQKILGRPLYKRYFSTKLDTPGSDIRLQRLCYNLVDDDRYVVVQYIGETSPVKMKDHSNKTANLPPITLSVDKNKAVVDASGNSIIQLSSDDIEQIMKTVKQMTPLTQQEMTDTGVSVLPVNNRKRLLHPDTVEALSKLQKIVDETQPETTFTTEEPSMYYMRSPQQLLANDVITIFKTLNTNRVARVPPHQPQPGDIFVFDNRRKSGENRNRWKYDGYSWSYRGVRSIQGGSVVKRYYAIRTALRKYNLGFQRVCFNLPGNTDFVVVHYYGDKSLHNPEIPIHVEKAHKALRMTATFPPTILEMYSNVPQLEGQIEPSTATTYLFAKSEEPIPFEYAYDVLTRENKINVSVLPPYQPCGGEIYLYDTHQHKRDWTADGYKWNNRGTTKCTKSKVKKIYGFINRREKRNSGFQRLAYMLYDEEVNYVIVQYIGDKSFYIPEPHGNCKNSTVPFERTVPSKLEQAKIELRSSTAHALYTKMATNEQVTNPTDKRLAIRDQRQLANLRRRVTTARKLSIDDMWDVYRMAQGAGTFVKHILVFPHFFSVAGIDDILNMVNDLLSQNLDVPLMFSCDTTLISEYSFSVLLCKHPAFTTNSVIPVGCVLHKQQFPMVFELFMNHLCQSVPQLKQAKCVFVLNRDEKFTEGLNMHCAQARVVYCWDQLRSLFSRTREADQYRSYKRDINTLLKSNTYYEFMDTYQNLRASWSRDKVKQFETIIKNAILNFSAKWVLESLSIYDSKVGVTKISCEMWTAIIKALFVKNEVKPTAVLSAFMELQKSVMQQINASFVTTEEVAPAFIHQEVVNVTYTNNYITL